MDSSSRSHTAGELLFHCLSCFVRAPCRALFKRRGQQTDAVHQHEKGSSVFSSTTTFTADASDYGVKQKAPTDQRPEDHSESSSTRSLSRTNSLTSLPTSVLDYERENGRTYHALSAGKYFMPSDKSEIERLDLQHYLIKMTLGGKACLCPKNEGAKRVLDLGAGSGIWCIEYADEHPDAEVIGVDLSPVQPTLVPPNCSFEIDDLEQDWTWSQPFDFILSRMMTGSYTDGAAIVKKAFDALEPGGYFEAQDLAPLGCDDGTLPADSALQVWMRTVARAMEAAGRPLTLARRWKALLEEAGFEDVVETVDKWPTNGWARDPRYKLLGQWNRANMDLVLVPALVAPATRALGWAPEEAVLLASRAREDLKNPAIHAYWPIYIVYGRKPLDARK